MKLKRKISLRGELFLADERTDKTTKLIVFPQIGERAQKGLDLESVYTLFFATLLCVLVPLLVREFCCYLYVLLFVID
jgi:hypothetical protein